MRFVVMADTHFVTPERARYEWDKYGGQSGWIWWNRILLLQEAEIRESLLRTVSALKPDFIIFSQASLIDAQLVSRGVLIPARGNAWVAGTPEDRSFVVSC